MESAARVEAVADVIGPTQPPRASATASDAPDRFSLRSIDILRGAAALGVVLYHAHGFFWRTGAPAPAFGSIAAALRSLTSLLLEQGWLGVHLFFVLSGFCI